MARRFPFAKVLGLDLNPQALRLGAINAQLSGTNIEFLESNLYAAVSAGTKPTEIDLIVSNPPYIASSKNGKDLPVYADGGASHGLDISVRIVKEGLDILAPGGIIVLYTGVAIPASDSGHDALLVELRNVKKSTIIQYKVLHPDMWPEEIGHGAYADVGRIQVVGAVLKRDA